jgi:peptide-methionine (S)-S-oxide reductase
MAGPSSWAAGIPAVISQHAFEEGTGMSENTETAILAGGCFWGMQEMFRTRDGVMSMRAGYTGGEVPGAACQRSGSVAAGCDQWYVDNSHAEAVEIVFDPERISYRDLLEYFFQIHDPTIKDRQGYEVGAYVRSEIFYTNDGQRRVAEDTIADVDASGRWPGKVVTQVSEAGSFWEAEPEHQGYYERNSTADMYHYERPRWKLPHRELA